MLEFVRWYNHQHKQSGLKFVTLAQRHDGKAKTILRYREQAYGAARLPWSGTLVSFDTKLERLFGYRGVHDYFSQLRR